MNNNDATIVKICLRIWGKDISPAEVTDLLKIEPSKCHSKGESISENGTIRNYKTGYWEISSPPEFEPQDIDSHLEYFLNICRNSKSSLSDISGIDGADIHFIVGVEENADSFEFGLCASVLAEIASVGLGVTFVVI